MEYDEESDQYYITDEKNTVIRRIEDGNTIYLYKDDPNFNPDPSF